MKQNNEVINKELKSIARKLEPLGNQLESLLLKYKLELSLNDRYFELKDYLKTIDNIINEFEKGI